MEPKDLITDRVMLAAALQESQTREKKLIESLRDIQEDLKCNLMDYTESHIKPIINKIDEILK